MFLFPKLNYTFLSGIQANKQDMKVYVDKDYCIVRVKNELIIVSYFRSCLKHNSQYYQIDFSSYSAEALYNLINQHNYLLRSISLSHALYISQEIYKAELSIILFQAYIQQ